MAGPEVWLPVGVLAAADWIAVARSNLRAEYLFKPATTAALIVVAAFIGDDSGAEHQLAFTLAALLFCLAGDIFLMLPRDFLLGGLVCFGVAHICLAIAFIGEVGLTGMLLIALIGVGAITVILFRPIRDALTERDRRLLIPVSVYAGLISVMVASAMTLMGDEEIPLGAAVAGVLGAALFYASDFMIAWTRFVRRLDWAPVAIMVTYHMGLSGLVLSLLR